MNASLSLDLDNKWSYMMVHGDEGWRALPSYLEIVIPRFLELLDRHRLKITVFIVGKDAAVPENQEVLRSIVRAGHEIGNHSFSHEPWFHKRSIDEVEREIAQAEDALHGAVGVRPIGFRGPGYARSPEMLDVLARRGYLYDASTLSTWIGPLARAYYLRSTRLADDDREQRNELFGSFADGLGPNRLHRTMTPSGSIAVVPVTTMPLLRIPIHLSYVMHLRTISRTLAQAYIRSALHACKLSGTQPSLLLHPLDFIGASECPELKFFPGMQLDLADRSSVTNDFLTVFSSMFSVKPLRDHVREEEIAKGAYLGTKVGAGGAK
jgi:peptidoglycan-N-acetylglucosamine deacetylase